MKDSQSIAITMVLKCGAQFYIINALNYKNYFKKSFLGIIKNSVYIQSYVCYIYGINFRIKSAFCKIHFSIFSRIFLTFLQRRRLPFVVRHLPHNFTAVALRLRATLWHSLLSQDLSPLPLSIFERRLAVRFAVST